MNQNSQNPKSTRGTPKGLYSNKIKSLPKKVKKKK